MVKALAGNVVDALKTNPLGLALVCVNLMFLVAFALVLREVSHSIERRDALIVQLTNCDAARRAP